jgi:hypothetical protein
VKSPWFGAHYGDDEAVREKEPGVTPCRIVAVEERRIELGERRGRIIDGSLDWRGIPKRKTKEVAQ